MQFFIVLRIIHSYSNYLHITDKDSANEWKDKRKSHFYFVFPECSLSSSKTQR